MHAADIVHGDLKPGNVRLDEEGRVCILDVESAIVDWQHVSAAERSRVMHTEGYAAPEVEDGVDCTPGSDVFSLGVMLRDNVSGSERSGAEGGEGLSGMTCHQASLTLVAMLRYSWV